jgi:hypothetical protein
MKNENGFTVVNPIIESDKDKIYRTVNTALSFVPAGSNIFQTIFSSPIQDRTDAWMKEVEAKIVELVSRGKIDLDNLSKRPEFSAIFLRIIQEVEISSQREKLQQLGNFAVALASGVHIAEDELYALTDMMKSLTPSHIKALQLYARVSDFEERFIQLHAFSVYKNTLGRKNFIETEPHIELAKVFFEDAALNVMGIETLKLNITFPYWKLVYKQLTNLSLIEKINTETSKVDDFFYIADDNAFQIRRTQERTSERVNYKISLTSRCTDIGIKLLNLITEGKY